MRDLRRLQESFQQFILQKNPTILPDIMDAPPVAPLVRLEIYEEGYYLRLLESLQSDYEVFAALLGKKTFDRIGRSYIQHFPSTFRSIRWFGKEFPMFLRQSQVLKNKDWLVELAEFEWSLTEVFDAKNFSVVTVEEMAAIPTERWPALCFKLQPAAKLIFLNWNAPAIWNAYKENKKIPRPKCANEAISWMLWRKEYEVQFTSLPEEERLLVEAVASGLTFSEICEKLCGLIDPTEVAFEVARLLKRLILDELISELSIST